MDDTIVEGVLAHAAGLDHLGVMLVALAPVGVIALVTVVIRSRRRPPVREC